MPFVRTVLATSAGFASILTTAVLPAAQAVTLETGTCSLTITNGVVVGLSNHLGSEVLLSAGDRGMGLCAMRRLGAGELREDQAKRLTVSKSGSGVEWSAEWGPAGSVVESQMLTQFVTEPRTGDIWVEQEGHLATNGLVGVSWGMASVPDQVEVLVPGCSGQRFGADAPAQRRTFDYPMTWEAPFVLVQGRRGGVIVWADDPSYRFKSLVLEHSQRMFRLRFESRSVAPFEEKQDIVSSRWRIRTYAGNWQAGAAIYRQWAKRRFGLVPLEQKGPAWARQIRFVVIMSLDQPLLQELASQCNPAQTLLYLPGWRKDGYDRNYPDYTANANLDPFVTEAHRLGFRVMLHVNYFGCDPGNPLYASLKQWQVRDPFSGESQWWEWPADPPIKFAYINPASRAWRETFVKRMVEAAGRYGADALHLDQTLCICNDKNGIIDGLNCLEGSLALHRELREALPGVALSGEGLNEITSQYEHFAQRHIWGMDHVHRTWDDRQVAMSHPISSAVLTPYTQIYGYLGMANPNDNALFQVWRRAYEHFGVLPTYPWPDKTQLDQPSSTVTALLQQARFFQQHQPTPDFMTPWQNTDLFVYRLNDGAQARFHLDQGVAFDAAPKGEAPRVLERRIEGVSEARLAGSIERWLAYNAEQIIGLNPERAYAWVAQPRDLAAPHLAALPPGYMLGRGGVHQAFARFQIIRSPAAEAANTIALWDYTGSVTGGVRLAGGVVRTFAGLEFEDEETSGAAHPDGDGLFMHPPWKGVKPVPGGGQNVTFLDYPLRLPDPGRVLFTSGVQLKAGAEGHSDGVTFRAVVTCGGDQRRCEVHHARESTASLELDLSAWRGKAVLLHLEADPGPAGAPDYDWGRFVRPRIVVQDNTPQARQTLRLAGFGLAEKLLAAEGEIEMTPPAATPARTKEIQARCRLPNTVIVPTTPPAATTLPVNLLQTSFASHVLFADGIEQPAYSYFAASVGEAKCGGQNRPALGLHPPPAGRSLADWWLKLPPTPARLVTAVGIRDGAKSQGVGFAIEVNGRKVFDKTVQVDAGWLPIEVSLAEWQNQPVAITFLTDSLKEWPFAWAAWAEPRIEAEHK
jgi:hypothetical protein